MTNVGIIPARGGSKGIPRKNLARLAGKELIAWSIEAARKSGLDRVVVTTDCEVIAETARRYGADVPFIRPASLALDETPTLPVLLHVIEALGLDGGTTLVLLQPTSPLRTADDIKACLEMHEKTGQNVVSVCALKARPSWLFARSPDGSLYPLDKRTPIATRRQGEHSIYVPNGAVYVSTAERLLNGSTFFDGAVSYVMPPERSVDIDDHADLLMAECLLQKQPQQLDQRGLEAIARTF